MRRYQAACSPMGERPVSRAAAEIDWSLPTSQGEFEEVAVFGSDVFRDVFRSGCMLASSSSRAGCPVCFAAHAAVGTSWRPRPSRQSPGSVQGGGARRALRKVCGAVDPLYGYRAGASAETGGRRLSALAGAFQLPINEKGSTMCSLFFDLVSVTYRYE